MSYSFKIWDQSHDGKTMAVRIFDLDELRRIASSHLGRSDDGVYPSFGSFVSSAGAAASPLSPYRITIDVYWATNFGYGKHRYFAQRVFEATYTGNLRISGGYAVQGYVMIDPDGFSNIGSSHLLPISVDIISGPIRDLLVVTI